MRRVVIGRNLNSPMDRLKFVQILFFSFLAFSCQNKLSKHTASLANQLSKYDILKTDSVDMSIPSNAYRLFVQIEHSSSNSELVALTNYDNSVVKGYALWALVNRKYPKLVPIFSHLLSSKDTVTTQYADVLDHVRLRFFLYRRVLMKISENDLSESDSLYYNRLKDGLNREIIYSDQIARDHSLYASYLLHSATEQAVKSKSNYERIRDLVIKFKNVNALVGLAKYKMPEDIRVIKSFKKEAFKAIFYFPDPSFWKFLISYRDSSKSQAYFNALAVYKNNEARNQLSAIYQRLSTNNDIEAIKDLDKSLITNYDPIYTELILKIWEEQKVIDLSMTKNLIRQYPVRSAKSFALGLSKMEPFHFITLDYFEQVEADSILSLMFDEIRTHNPALMPEVLRGSIMSADFVSEGIILKQIQQRKLEYTKPMLLERLEQETYPFDMYHVAETLLEFDDPDVKTKVTGILRKQKSRWDDEHWIKAFQKLFKKYGIEIES